MDGKQNNVPHTQLLFFYTANPMKSFVHVYSLFLMFILYSFVYFPYYD